jgi:glutamyl-tRNA synthetase
MTPRLRFAPSPTGPLHLGGARTALYNWAAARAMGGKFLLRIEDTDQARSTDASLQIIFDGLRWLGLDWDEGPGAGGAFGPYFQMQRLERYAAWAERLLQSGHAYRCYATPEEVEEGRQALAAQGKKPMYDRRHRDLTPAQQQAFEREGRQASLRFRIPLGRTVVLDDLCKGRVEVATDELDDWVMLRPDGVPLYNFACVVDDHEMQITHVVRGEEHLMNGFKQLLLFAAIDAPPPRYSHIPLILGKDGRKLSKREASVNILDYRDAGYPAEAVFNAIALLGWSWSGDRELFSRDELVQKFRIEDIHKGGAKFDLDKLQAICGEYVRRIPVAELAARVQPFLVAAGWPESALTTHPQWVQAIVAAYQERFRLYSELAPQIRFLLDEHVTPDADAQQKLAEPPAAREWLRAYAARLERLPLAPSYPSPRLDADAAGQTRFATPAQLEADAREFAAGLGIKFGQLVHPLRAALTGTTKGAGLFVLLHLIGRERARLRLGGSASQA